jgi:hypothetical protein
LRNTILPFFDFFDLAVKNSSWLTILQPDGFAVLESKRDSLGFNRLFMAGK